MQAIPESSRPPRPHPLWVIAGLAAIVGISAWVLGAYGDRTSGPPTPGTVLSTEADDPSASGSLVRDQVTAAEAFWAAAGAGDLAAVLDLIDLTTGPTLAHYAGFITGFGAGFETEDCRSAGPGAIRCTLHVANSDLITLYHSGAGTTAYTTSATVTISGEGIDSFEMPDLVGRASAHLVSFSRSTTGLPEPCERINYDSLDLPPFSTTIAQTDECGRALADLLPDAIESAGY